ncbi:hypothetical protein CCMSSC00406_0010256 [Pleurotus cornucopiae]|uniref:Uncharacterized protein n=1 Tax=Pleurotus cornucopiae TaxID=5321 RepID=A0ACB7IIN5_PLECO|nr:hypothetical protein CCMSSC00406_0010256 [Pleurotus cornucopiae]
MSIELLETCDNPPTHRYRHDLESFLYILIWAMVNYNMGSEELNIPPDPKQPRRLLTHSLLQPWEGDDYQYNALTKTGIDHLPEYRRKLLGAVQPAFKPLIDKWLVPLLRLFSNARHYLTWSAQDGDFDAETLGGILTFEKFMKAIGVVPRQIPE